MQLRRGRVAVLLAGVLVVLGVITALVVADRGDKISTVPASPAAAYDSRAPNVVVVMTDDQAFETMRAMPLTRRLIGDAGTTFDNAFVSFPLCCPSRATFLTGQYAHNNGVRDNHPPAGGYQALDKQRTLPVWLSRAGYETGFVGKYLNGYGEGAAIREVPPGWSEWYAVPGRNKQRAFDFDLNENGELVHYDRRGERPNYKTKVLADKAAGFVRRRAPGERPFFLWVATNGPHKDSGLPEDAARNPEPAPRDRGRFEGRRAPRRTATNEYDVSDKPRSVRELPLLGPEANRLIDRYYVSQLEAVASIDRLVARLARRLRRAGELEDTLFIFTTDNGLLLGEHRLEGKSRPYEEAIHVPLLVRGPGFARGEHDTRLVSNVDLAPTILDATGATPDLTVDGRSIRPGAGGPRRRGVLLEVFERNQSFTGLRTPRYTYAEYEDGERELYDLRRDPEELDNLARDRRYEGVRRRLAARLAALRDCAGPSECG
ncbi:MAG: sulfatase-like hydrolase/transferase [Solirubrobacterales bacterium]|nr:sulfatase-like hydrolase/transferase [Solirubrobacterales bacterium]